MQHPPAAHLFAPYRILGQLRRTREQALLAKSEALTTPLLHGRIVKVYHHVGYLARFTFPHAP